MEKKIDYMDTKTIIENTCREFNERKNRGNELIRLMRRAVLSQKSDIYYADEHLKKQLIAEILRYM